MFRECVALLSLAALCPACSFITNFDKELPIDASPDAPYTQAECEFGEPNDSLAEASMITATDTGPAAICAPATGNPDDRDFYKFTASGNPATISITFDNRPGGDLDLKLYDASGTMVAQSRGFGGSEMIVCPASSPACPALMAGMDYTIEIFAGVSGSVNSYSFSLVP